MTNPFIDKFGNKYWYSERGQLHRVDGPAYEGSTGHKEWWINGKRHRVDGPAFIGRSGREYWLVNGKEIDIKPILERFDISPDWRNWTDAEKMIVRLVLS